MSFDLSQLSSERICRAPRIIMLGVPKVGKSTFACGAPNPVVLPIKGEEGVDDLVGLNGTQVTPTCESFSDTLGWLYSLYQGDHDRQSVVIDSSSALQPLLWDATIARWNSIKGEKEKTASSIETVGGGYAKGYTEALNEWRQLTEVLDALRNDKGMLSIIIGHVVVKQVTDPLVGVFDAYEWNIDKRAASMLYQWADCILFANQKGVVKKEDAGFNKEAKRGIDSGQRSLFTQHRLAHPGGGRGPYGQLPYEMDLNFGSFMEAVSQASN